MFETCPTCSGPIGTSSICVPIDKLPVPPEQTEKYLRITRWQCTRDDTHSGEEHEPLDVPDTPTGA